MAGMMVVMLGVMMDAVMAVKMVDSTEVELVEK